MNSRGTDAIELCILAVRLPLAEKARAELAALKDGGAQAERVAQLTAHRVCCGTDHDPLNGKLHGYCIVCGVPWPCEYAGRPPAYSDCGGEPRRVSGMDQIRVPAREVTPYGASGETPDSPIPAPWVDAPLDSFDFCGRKVSEALVETCEMYEKSGFNPTYKGAAISALEEFWYRMTGKHLDWDTVVWPKLEASQKGERSQTST